MLLRSKNRAARLQLQNVPTLASAAAVSICSCPTRNSSLQKKHQVKELMEKHCKVRPIIGMDENPWHYRHKVQAVFGLDRKKQQISGVYEEKTHRILPVETCLIEDQKADAIIATVRSLLKSFKIKVYDEDTGYGLLRYVLRSERQNSRMKSWLFW